MEKKYNHIQSQKDAQQLWNAEKTYDHTHQSGPLFAIDTPPPTVSGTLHIGHVFSYTQTDIIARYRRMLGSKVFYPFGFDDNGLPTERYVEKKNNTKGHILGRKSFIDLCLKESAIAAQTFKTLWQDLGISAYWDATYSTISDDARKISQQSFLQLLKDKNVYRRFEPAIYCTACRTSVAQAELDDASVPCSFNTIAFIDERGDELLIATTRPELLPSCVALLYHPSDERYMHLQKKMATVPLFNHHVPILADDLVNPEKGTGLVMVCTFGDTTDIEWYKKHNLAYKQAIGLDGIMMPHTGILAGLKVNAAREKVIEALKESGVLRAQTSLVHTVGVHERCKNPVEYILLAQWFVSILNHKKKFLDAADTIDWHPHFMKSRYIDWVENLKWDWGISRQRMYGIPFPVWHCLDCQMVICADATQLPLDPQQTPYTKPCPSCAGTNIVADTDVMDTWNTSSLTPYIVHDLYQKSTGEDTKNIFTKDHLGFLPMAMRPQAHDIIRTWAFDTIVKSVLHHNTIPWKSIVISGHVLSSQKEKISKSKGNNSMDPERLLSEYSADAIRYWTASAGLGYDVAFSVDQLKIGQRLVTKLWNAFLFAEPHLTLLTNPQAIPERFGMINEWLLHELTLAEQRYHASLQTFEFGPALHAIETFFWQHYCDNYIELVKHQLFNPDAYDQATVTATRYTLYHVGIRLLHLYAPFVPFVTEAIYQALYRAVTDASSLHARTFASNQVPYVFVESHKNTQAIIEIASTVRKLKTEQQLSLKTPLKELVIMSNNADLLDMIKTENTTILGITQAETAIYRQANPENISEFIDSGDQTYCIRVLI